MGIIFEGGRSFASHRAAYFNNWVGFSTEGVGYSRYLRRHPVARSLASAGGEPAWFDENEAV